MGGWGRRTTRTAAADAAGGRGTGSSLLTDRNNCAVDAGLASSRICRHRHPISCRTLYCIYFETIMSVGLLRYRSDICCRASDPNRQTRGRSQASWDGLSGRSAAARGSALQNRRTEPERAPPIPANSHRLPKDHAVNSAKEMTLVSRVGARRAPNSEFREPTHTRRAQHPAVPPPGTPDGVAICRHKPSKPERPCRQIGTTDENEDRRCAHTVARRPLPGTKRDMVFARTND